METNKALIQVGADGTIAFGDYTLAQKTKLEDFEHAGDLYKIKTFCEITKLERNGRFVYESVPGTTVSSYKETENSVEFCVEGQQDAQITLELEAETDYEVSVKGEIVGTMKTNLGGKLSISVELGSADAIAVKVEKC